jgi:single-strand DNA-binding protein
MNNWTIAGRLGKDAETRHTSSGKAVTGFSVAVDQRHGGEKTTLWVDCSIWGERGQALAQYLTKGTTVCVSGEASARQHDGKVYMSLNVRELTLLGGGQRDGHSGRPNDQQHRATPANQGDISGDIPDDFGDATIPF